MRTSSEYRNSAWEQLSGKWEPALVLTLVFLVLSFIASTIDNLFLSTGIISMLLLAPIQYSYNIQMLENTRSGNALEAKALFAAYNDYTRITGTYLLEVLYIFLWSLLLVIPGIIKAISYSQVNFILHDEPSLAYDKAIERSMAMMDGHKWDYFCLLLSFIGWHLLGIITFGIGYLWVIPYEAKACALFYEDLKKEYAAKQNA